MSAHSATFERHEASARTVVTATVLLVAAIVVSVRHLNHDVVFGVSLLCLGPLLFHLVVIDLREHRLPDVWTGALGAITLTCGLVASVADGSFGLITRMFCGAAAMGTFYLVLALLGRGEGMGLGDVKLAPSIGAIAAWDAWSSLLEALCWAFLGGGVVAGLLLLRGRGRHARIPFGPFMIGGLIVALW